MEILDFHKLDRPHICRVKVWCPCHRFHCIIQGKSHLSSSRHRTTDWSVIALCKVNISITHYLIYIMPAHKELWLWNINGFYMLLILACQSHLWWCLGYGAIGDTLMCRRFKVWSWELLSPLIIFTHHRPSAYVTFDDILIKKVLIPVDNIIGTIEK